MFEIIEYPTGGYGIKMMYAKFEIEVNGKRWDTLYLYSFTQNKFIDLGEYQKNNGPCIIPIEFKHAQFSYVVRCIAEMSGKLIDPLAETKEPF